jgi:hypothetical protein
MKVNRPWRPIGLKLSQFLDIKLTDGGDVVRPYAPRKIPDVRFC